LKHEVEADSNGLGLGLGVVQASARASEHGREGVERSGPQSQGHGPDLEVDDLALGAEVHDVAAIGREELERVSVAHRCTLSKVKTVFNIEIQKGF
jgi:hypothetical protein